MPIVKVYRGARTGISAVQADWIARSTAAGVLYATDFSNNAVDFHQTNHVFGGNFGPGIAYWKSLVTQYTGDSRLPYCMRISSPASTGANGASWIASLNPAWTSKTQGMGSTEFWLSFRFKVPSSRLIPRVGDGFKVVNVSAYDPADPQSSISHTNFEHVLQNIQWKNIPVMYRDTTGSGDVSPGQTLFQVSGPNGLTIQDIDRGSGATANDQFCLYNGGAWPTAGCWTWYPGEWVALRMRFKIAAYGATGTTGNEFDLDGCREGGSGWTPIYQQRNYSLGDLSDGYSGGICGVQLPAYETSYDNSGSTDTEQYYGQLIVSLSAIAAPAANA